MRKPLLYIALAAALIILVLVWIVGSVISYMSLNDWDLRCVFVDCKVVTTRGD